VLKVSVQLRLFPEKEMNTDFIVSIKVVYVSPAQTKNTRSCFSSSV